MIITLTKIVIFIIVLFSFCFSQSKENFIIESNIRCGTLHFAEAIKESIKNPQKKNLRKSLSYDCISEYGEVLNKKTKNFIIFYTTTGVHRIKNLAYIDTLAKYLEQAYGLYKDSLGMKGIKGARQTYHYLQPNNTPLYPVEVLDLELLRETNGDYNRVFGLTFSPIIKYPDESQIAIENDFLYGADCFGNIANKPFFHNIDYSINWNLALKITAFHELYHSFQFTYFNLLENHSFWLESSAAGVEEIGAPEVNDYIIHLGNIFRNTTPISMENLPYKQLEYGFSSFYLFLFSEFGAKFDSKIWEYFSKSPKDKFSVHLARLLDSLGVKPEELYHKYARSVFFSGNRAALAPKDSLFWAKDQSLWPPWNIGENISYILPESSIYFTKNKPIKTDSMIVSNLIYGDSSVWVLSRLLETDYIPHVIPKEFIAYPNPWNPQTISVIKFGTLPKKATGIEIRSSDGLLLERIKGKEGEVLVWKPKKTPAPGILYYRTLPYGKNKKLIVNY